MNLTPNVSIAVIGCGSWATAQVKILSENHNTVNWYVHDEKIRVHLLKHRSNPEFITQVHFSSKKLNIYDDICKAVADSDIVLLATPSPYIKSVMAPLEHNCFDGKIVLSAIKGITPDDYLTIAEYINRTYNLPFDQIGIVSGPCHAEEVALERLSYLTIVFKDEELAAQVGKLYHNSYINIVTSRDIYGVEYGAVLKNIYAIAIGVCHSMGYGDNFIAVLISNATREMDNFMNATYTAPRNVQDSVYLGDLLVTCYSQFSRNRTFGLMIGKGYSVRAAQMEMNMVAEGYYATACIQKVKERCDISIEMPIADAMYAILYLNKDARTEIKRILRKLR